MGMELIHPVAIAAAALFGVLCIVVTIEFKRALTELTLCRSVADRVLDAISERP